MSDPERSEDGLLGGEAQAPDPDAEDERAAQGEDPTAPDRGFEGGEPPDTERSSG